MSKKMDIQIQNDRIMLNRAQWKGNDAYISNYPGLLDEVKKYTWTYTGGKHAYLRCASLKMSLHQFVLQFLYGKEKLDRMIGNSNIIEHLDNNGLNCTFENLHVLSADANKAKAFSIDKKNEALDSDTLSAIPALITDVYYSHEHNYFQLQVFFNKNLVFSETQKQFVESFIFQYSDFDRLFIDWLYCFECIKNEEFCVEKTNADEVITEFVHLIELREEEKYSPTIIRDGQLYMVVNTDPQMGPISFMNHTSYRKIQENKES